MDTRELVACLRDLLKITADLHERVVNIEQYLLDEAEQKSSLPFFNTDRVSFNKEKHKWEVTN